MVTKIGWEDLDKGVPVDVYCNICCCKFKEQVVPEYRNYFVMIAHHDYCKECRAKWGKK